MDFAILIINWVYWILFVQCKLFCCFELLLFIVLIRHSEESIRETLEHRISTTYWSIYTGYEKSYMREDIENVEYYLVRNHNRKLIDVRAYFPTLGDSALSRNVKIIFERVLML